MMESVWLLKNDAYFFYQCRTLQEAREILKKEDITLVLLDVNLPDGNGIDFVREIRKNSQVPIILLTVNNMEVDIVTGLEAGANDYITKPFGIGELRARVAAHLRREKRERKHFLEAGEVRFQIQAKKMFYQETEIPMTKSEYAICEYLAVIQGRSFPRSGSMRLYTGMMERVMSPPLPNM